MPGLFQKIIRQAYLMVKGYKTFRWQGLFLVWLNLFRSLAAGYIILLIVQTKWQIPNMVMDPEQASENKWVGLVWLAAILLIVYFYFKNKTALIFSVKELQTKQRLDPVLVKELTEPYVGLLLKIGLLVGLLGSVLILVLFAPLPELVWGNFQQTSMLYLTTAIILAVPIGWLLYIFSVFVPMFIVLQGMSVGNAFKTSLDWVKRQWPWLGYFTLGMWIIEILWFILTSVLALLVAGAFVLLIRIFYDMVGEGWLEIIYGLAGTAVFVVFFILQAWITAFQKVAWTILFLEMTTPVKYEENLSEVPSLEIAR